MKRHTPLYLGTLLFFISSSLFAAIDGNGLKPFLFTVKAGYDMGSKIKQNTDLEIDGDTIEEEDYEDSDLEANSWNMDGNFSFGIEAAAEVRPYLYLGGGATYRINRAVDDSDADEDYRFAMLPLYSMAKYFFAPRMTMGTTGKLYPYITGHLGYNFFFPNREYKDDVEEYFEDDAVISYNGGIYWALGFGVALSSGLEFELLYSVDSINEIARGSEEDYDYDFEYNRNTVYPKTSLYVGYNF